MTADEFRQAFADLPTDGHSCHIQVVTRGGRLYDVHEDQKEGVDDQSLIYGTPVERHLRDNNLVRWSRLRNLRLADADDQANT